MTPNLAQKSWYLSVTMWAGIASILVGFGKLVGVEIDQQELTNAFVGLSDPLSQIIGGAIVMWGRKRAKEVIK